MNDAVAKKHMGILGATSFVGSSLLPLLTEAGCRVTAFSRQINEESFNGVIWRKLPLPPDHIFEEEENIPYWICVAPIWILPDYFDLLEAYGARRIVAISSTSRFTKDNSSDLAEQAVAKRLADTEKAVQTWAAKHDIEWLILRPTLVYGRGQDKNITEIIRFIRRFGFFPLLGKAKGLRQPVHCEDVANVCVTALNESNVTNRAYNISGGETLTYRDMVNRVFRALDLQPRLFSIPLSLFKFAVACLRLLPGYRHWSVAMAERMNRDLIFDHTDASQDLGYKPRAFVLLEKDILVK